MVFGWPSRKTSYLYLMYVSMASCMVSKQFVVWIIRLNLYMLRNLYYGFTMSIRMLNQICCTNGYGWNRMFKYMFKGDWLYMLFMHQACVYETKQQYMKSNKILTAVIKEAHLNCRTNDILKEAIQAFQVKLNVKQEYLAYYVWKHIHNCYGAMTTSPVESINCHIKHRSKESTLNNTAGLWCW